MKPTFNIFCLVVVVVFFSKCKTTHVDKYCPSDETTLSLSEDDKKWLAFSTQDTIWYEDSVGNTIHFNKVSSFNGIRTDERCDNLLYEYEGVTYSNSSNCPPSATFSINHKHNISLYNQIHKNFPYDTLVCYISFGIYNIHGNNSCVSDMSFYTNASQITFDSLDIRNRRFYNVYKFRSGGASSMDFYFTKEQGIVTFYDRDSILWVQNP